MKTTDELKRDIEVQNAINCLKAIKQLLEESEDGTLTLTKYGNFFQALKKIVLPFEIEDFKKAFDALPELPEEMKQRISAGNINPFTITGGGGSDE